MSTTRQRFCTAYRTALRAYLKAARGAGPEAARGLGERAMRAGVQTPDLAKLHEDTLTRDVLPDCPPGRHEAMIRRAGGFFSAAITPLEASLGVRNGMPARPGDLIALLSRRTVELAAANVELSIEVERRKEVEANLRKSERHHMDQLTRSNRLQERLKHLSRGILSVQEDERRRISRELHDVIVQTLTGINLQLDSLRKDADGKSRSLARKVLATQRLVGKSVEIVHKFARELRPAVLDDLGLVPALSSFAKSFSRGTGVRIHITASREVDALDSRQRTALYRVAQEAMTNVSKHAAASRVEVDLSRVGNDLRMTLTDDGKSFEPSRVEHSRSRTRLGLLGMKERLQMVGGTLSVHSAPGHGTSVVATVPITSSRRPRKPQAWPARTQKT